MPIEVRELVIKAAVVQEGTPTSGTKTMENNTVSNDEEIVRICVERILEIIKEKTER